MSITTPPLEELIRDLPPSLRLEVHDFVEFLLHKRMNSVRTTLRQDWADAGTLTAVTMTSVELQHQALIWRAE